MFYGYSANYYHMENEHRGQVKRDGVLYAARRVDALNRRGIILVDPGRTDRHVLRHQHKLGENVNLVKGIVRRCLLEVRALHGDERRQDKSVQIKEEYEALLSKNPSVSEPVALRYY